MTTVRCWGGGGDELAPSLVRELGMNEGPDANYTKKKKYTERYSVCLCEKEREKERELETKKHTKGRVELCHAALNSAAAWCARMLCVGDCCPVRVSHFHIYLKEPHSL